MRSLSPLIASTLATLVACRSAEKSDVLTDSAPPEVEVEGDDAGECSDGADNDGNGAFDCDDPACAASPDCDGDDAEELDENEPPSAPTVNLAPMHPTTVDDVTCGRIADSLDPDGDSLIYLVRFLVDGVLVQEGQSQTLSSDRFRKGQTISCSTAANDGQVTGEAGLADPVVVANSVPTVENVTVTPATIVAGDTLECSYDFLDADLDVDASTVSWSVDGLETATGTRFASDFIHGAVISCTVTPSDGENNGASAAATVLVDNSPPTIDEVYMTPADADIRDTLTCTPGTTDDGDADASFTYTYMWEVDGATITTTTQTLDPTEFEVGSTVRCAATANDGMDDGDPTWSDSQTILSGPDLQLSDTSWDHGTVESGCTDDYELTLTNAGTDTLLVTGLTVSGDAEFTTDFLAALSIEPGASETTTLYFAPESESSYSATITLTSNDPDGDQTVDLLGDGEWAALSESQTGTGGGEVDMLFAIDRSSSMHDDIAILETALSDMIATMNDHGTDFQLTAVVEDDGCINGSDTFIDSTFTASEATDAISAMINLTGTYGSHNRQAFRLLESALDQTGTGDCNQGLIRFGAQLALVGVSDSSEQSPGTWSDYVSEFQALKSDPTDVVFHAIGGDDPSGCASASAYSGMYDAVDATGGSFISICTTDLSTDLGAIASDIAEATATYGLADEPWDESSITVYVDGTDVTGDWSYDDISNAVIFHTSMPATSSTVLIEYDGTHTACE